MNLSVDFVIRRSGVSFRTAIKIDEYYFEQNDFEFIYSLTNYLINFKIRKRKKTHEKYKK